MSRKLTHIGEDGSAHMVDVGEKAVTHRIAVATGRVTMLPETLDMILSGNAKKGDVLGTARIAGIMAAKKTPELVPLCHPIALTNVSIDISQDKASNGSSGLIVTATTRTTGQTGVEMEALTAASVTCLTIYDMAKAADRGMVISDLHLVEKSGGKSGHWRVDESEASLGT